MKNDQFKTFLVSALTYILQENVSTLGNAVILIYPCEPRIYQQIVKSLGLSKVVHE
jgi:hypothetical protein